MALLSSGDERPDTTKKKKATPKFAEVRSKQIDTLTMQMKQTNDMLLQLIKLDSLEKAGHQPEQKIIKNKIKK